MCLEDPAKAVVFGVNIICAIAGVVLIILGVVYELPYYELSDKLPPEYIFLRWVPVAIIVVGVTVILVAALGCFGIIKQGPTLLHTYSIFLLIIFVAQIAIGAFAFISINNPKDLHRKIDANLNTIFLNAKNDNDTLPADIIQESFKCCGRDGPDFWSIKPSSCYAEEKIEPNNLYRKGCVREVTNFIKTSARIMAIVTLATSLIQLVCSCLGFYFARHVTDTQSIQNYKFRFRR